MINVSTAAFSSLYMDTHGRKSRAGWLRCHYYSWIQSRMGQNASVQRYGVWVGGLLAQGRAIYSHLLHLSTDSMAKDILLLKNVIDVIFLFSPTTRSYQISNERNEAICDFKRCSATNPESWHSHTDLVLAIPCPVSGRVYKLAGHMVGDQHCYIDDRFQPHWHSSFKVNA